MNPPDTCPPSAYGHVQPVAPERFIRIGEIAAILLRNKAIIVGVTLLVTVLTLLFYY